MLLRPGVALLASLFALLAPAFGQQQYSIESIAGKPFTDEGAAPLETRLNFPWGLAVKGDGTLCFSDTDHFWVRCDENGAVRTVAGTGVLGFSDTEGPGTEAPLVEPQGLAYAPDGSLYIADTAALVVYRVAPDGTISIFAGTGESGDEGEDGPAAEAQLEEPTDVAVDAAGNVYIADAFSDRVLIVGTDGILRRYAGSGDTGYEGDGGPATMAELFDPTAIALGPAGELYIADRTNDVIRRVDADGIIETVVGTGQTGFFGDGGSPLQAQLDTPSSLAVDAAGILYIGDANDRIRAVDFTADIITTVAGNGEFTYMGAGPATEVALPGPHGIAASADGRVFISSGPADRIFELVDGQLQIVVGRSHFSGDGGAATEASLGVVEGMETGSVYVADLGNYRVRKIDDTGMIQTLAGNGISASSGDGGPALDAGMIPIDVLPEPDGSILVLDGNGFIRRIRADGSIQRVAGTGEIELGFPDEIVPAIQSSLGIPMRIDRDAAGNIYLMQNMLVESLFSVQLEIIVRRISPSGSIVTILGGGRSIDERVLGLQATIQQSSDFAVSDDGRVCFADNRFRRLRCLDTDGLVRTVVGPTTDAALTAEGMIQQLTPFFVLGVAMGPDGELYFSDVITNQVLRVDGNGGARVIAGTGDPGFSGDGGPALAAQLHRPRQVTVDSEGRVVVWDQQNWRIRRLTPSEPTVLISAAANAASFAGGATAPAAIVSLFGADLAAVTEIATELPLPTTLSGVTVEVTDSAGETRASRLFFVSAGQINLEIPAGTAQGPATLRVMSPAGAAELAITIESVAPGLFAIDATGAGVAAAAAIRIAADGTQSEAQVFDAAQTPIAAVPIDLGPEGEQVVLLLFGTGIRGAATVEVTMNGEPAQVLGFAAQPDFVGLDQINVAIPRSLIGAGEVTIVVTADGKVANEVTINVL